MIPLPAGLRSYVIGGIGVVAVAGVATSSMAYFYVREIKANLHAAEREVESLQTYNKSLADTISNQVAAQAREQQNILALNTSLTALGARYEEVENSLKRLERTNAEIQKYFATPVPADVRKLLRESGYTGK